jgi:hypothetical protein
VAGLLRKIAIVCLLPITVILTGCMDMENALRFESGSVVLTSRFVFDKEMEDVFGYLEYVARLSKNPEAAVLTTGVCASLGVAGASAPEGTTITSRQYKEGDHLVCELRVRAKELSGEAQNIAGLDFFTITDNAKLRQKQLNIDFEKLPDISPFLMAGLTEQAKQNPDFAGSLSNRDMVELLERTKRAMIAATVMAARGRYVDFSVSGARIVETDGKIAGDGRSAKLRMTYAELAEILLNPEARHNKRFFAVVAY